MFNNILKLFSWSFIIRIIHRIFIQGISRYLIPCYLFTIIVVVFQCFVINPFTVEGNEISKFGGNRFNFRNGLLKAREDTLLPILSNGIQSFQFSQYLVPEFDRSLRNSAFSIVMVSDITNKGSQQYSSQDSIDIVKNDFHYFLGLPWWVWLIIISSIILNITQPVIIQLQYKTIAGCLFSVKRKIHLKYLLKFITLSK